MSQVEYPSKDGTRVTMFLVHRRDVDPNGEPADVPHRVRRLQHQHDAGVLALAAAVAGAGGVVAMPNLRGGGEYGEAWHQGGMLGRKQNSFDDFIAAAEWLIAAG